MTQLVWWELTGDLITLEPYNALRTWGAGLVGVFIYRKFTWALVAFFLATFGIGKQAAV